MGINIKDLAPVGASLFSDSESLMGNIRSLAEDELKISGGGGYCGSGSGSGKSKSKSKSKKSGSKKSGSGSGCYGCGCGYNC